MPFVETTIGLNVVLAGAGQVLQLCYLIYEKSHLIKRYKDDCSKLRDFVQRVEVVLKDTTAAADAKDPGWVAALQALEAALQEVDRIFEDCATCGKIKSLLNADVMNTRLGAISQRLHLALAMIPIQKANVAETKLVELRALQLALQQAQWSASKAAEQQAEQLRRLADQNAVDAGISHQMLAEILALLKADAADKANTSSSQAVAAAAAPAAAAGVASAAPQAYGGVQYSQLEAEKQELTRYMRELNLRSQTRQQEAPCLRAMTSIIQAIDCLEHSTSAEGAASAPLAPPDTTGHTSSSSSPQAAAAAAAAAGAAAAAASADSDPRPPMDLVCSITLQLFHDPVLLVGSGCTYERRAIEQWLAAGKTKDPETGVRLTDFRLAPNLAIRRQARDWLDRHPEYPAPAWLNQQQQQQDQKQLQGQQQQEQQAGSCGAASAAAAGATFLAPAKPGQILKPLVLDYSDSDTDSATQAPAAVLYSQHQQQHWQQQHVQSSSQSEKQQALAAYAARAAAGGSAMAQQQQQQQHFAGEFVEESVFMKAAAGCGHPSAAAAAAADAPLVPASGNAPWAMQCILLEQYSEQ